MLAVEQEPISLAEIAQEGSGRDGHWIDLQSGRRILLPAKFAALWAQVKQGASIYDLCNWQRIRGQTGSVFLDVARFLCFLVDHDLVNEVRLVHLAESIRGQFEWPRDAVSSASVSFRLFHWGRRPGLRSSGPSQWAALVDSLLALVSLLSLFGLSLYAISSMPRDGSWNVEIPIQYWVVGLFWSGVLGRTSIAISRCIANRVNGDGGELSLTVDPFGPHLDFFPTTVTGPFHRACDFLICFGFVTLPLAIVLKMFDSIAAVPSIGSTNSHVMMASSAVLFMIALGNHPSARSLLTRSLQIWNRTPMVWREDDELQEVEAFYRIGAFLSIVLATLSFALLLRVAALRLSDLRHTSLDALESSVRNHLLVLVAILLASAYIYLEPFMADVLNRVAPINRRRRLWATKPRVLDVASSERDAWADLPILRQLTAPLRKQLLNQARHVNFQAGQAVCRQGASDRSLFIVLSGRLAVAKSFGGRRRKVVAILAEGAVFGETAFFFASKRTADVVAMDDCRLIEIRYQPSMRDLDISSSEEFQFRVWLLQALASNELLRDLPSEAMDTLIFAGRRKTFKSGQAIFTEGAPADACYFIAQGRASAIQGGRKINEMGAGHAFGEIALLQAGGRRTATVVADSDLLCMELDVDAFWSLLSSRLPLGVEIERLALRRLRSDHER